MPAARDGRRSPGEWLVIHQLAHDGDVPGMAIKLERDPFLLNAKTRVILYTPLHVAAANNKTEVVKFLLEQNGSVEIDMEAMNICGETPLHIAAKNGNEHPVETLLAAGASLEARTRNRMTPLHLAVLNALQTKRFDTVRTLLEYNADCSARDDEGKTPIDHLVGGDASDKLRELFDMYTGKQRMHKAAECFNEAGNIMVKIDKEISNIVGLEELKVQLRVWAKGMLLDEWRRSLGLNINPRRPPHMAFLGNAGTGKTMVARILGKVLHMVGVLPTDKVTEVQRTDLVGEFVGHTGPKTRRKISEAEGGILFVDEAYRLIPMQKADEKDYGIEALEEIMSFMDSGKVVVIFAGYPELMQRVISCNPGFCRRVTKFFHFDDFTAHELAQILHIKMNDHQHGAGGLLRGFKLHPTCSIEAVGELIGRMTTAEQRKAKNGGLIDRLLETARDNLDSRLHWHCMDTEALVTFTMEDLEEGLSKC